jgi:hypothetical protein
VTDFTLKNLKELEDSAANRGPEIEARFGRKHLETQHLGVSYFRFGPGFQGSVRASPSRAGTDGAPAPAPMA